MEYHRNQPFNDNMLRPCPLLDNAGKLAEMVDQTGARSTDLRHPEDAHATDLVRRYVRYGVSPRGGQALTLGAKVTALLSGRYNVSFEDVHFVDRDYGWAVGDEGAILSTVDRGRYGLYFTSCRMP